MFRNKMKALWASFVVALGLLAGNVLAEGTVGLLYNGEFEEIYKVTAELQETNNWWKKNKQYNAAGVDYLLPKRLPSIIGKRGEGPGWWTCRGKGGQYAIQIDEKTRHSGKYSMSIRNTNPEKTGSGSVCWSHVPMAPDKKYLLSGWVSAREATDISVHYGLSGEKQAASFSKFLGEGTFDWKPFKIEIDTSQNRLPMKVETFYLHLTNKGEGQVWFDDISLIPTPR